MLKKKQAEKEALAKPTFLTKKQREELALARRAEDTLAHGVVDVRTIVKFARHGRQSRRSNSAPGV